MRAALHCSHFRYRETEYCMDYKTLLPILSVLLAVVALIVNPFINIHVKFAQDAEMARLHVKLILARLAQGLSAAFAVVSLTVEMLSTQPVTPLMVLCIAVNVAVLLLLYISMLLRMVLSAMGSQTDLIGRLAESVKPKNGPKS